MAFWTKPFNGQDRVGDPKRNFRFKVSFVNSQFAPNGDTVWYAKKVNQPQITIGEASHDFLIHKFYWPGKVEWNEIDMTLVDPVEPHVSYKFLEAIQNAGFKVPADSNQFSSVSKSSAALQLGDVIIESIDDVGATLHSWKLIHAWAKEISFSELDYGSEDLSEITLKVRYDWAEFSTGQSQYLDVKGQKLFNV